MSFLVRAISDFTMKARDKLKTRCHDCKEEVWLIHIKVWEGGSMQQFRVCSQCYEKRSRMINDWRNIPWEYWFYLIDNPDFRMLR